jgi:fused signal recognition particle receptor
MGIFSKFVAKLKGQSTADPLDWKVLEEELLAADLGPKLTAEILKSAQGLKGDDALSSLTQILNSHLSSKPRVLSDANSVGVILVVGVNGTGKTTSVAKLANLLKSSGSSVMLAAADTFRAAAVEQLGTWAERTKVEFHRGPDRADPAAVAFDGAKRAVAEGVQIHLIDTAGRLHTESNLMNELAKVRRVVEKVTPVDETLLVLDATTGQNAIVQAREFMATTPITGIILTKMDGSAKGGSVLAVERELQIPIKFIGTGEQVTDLKAFEPSEFIAGLF